MSEIAKCPTCGAPARAIPSGGYIQRHELQARPVRYEPVSLDALERELLEAGMTAITREAEYMEISKAPAENYDKWLVMRADARIAYQNATKIWRELSSDLIAARAREAT